MRLTVGHSMDVDEAVAAAEAVRGALLGSVEPALAIVLSTDQYDARRLTEALVKELDGLPFAGCCTAGVMDGDLFLLQGLVVGVLSGPGVRCGIGLCGLVTESPRDAGRRAVAEALSGLPLLGPDFQRTLIVLPDAVFANPTEAVRGAASEGGSGVRWCGGGTGDNFKFVRTAQYSAAGAVVDHVVVIAIDSPERVGIGLGHGWVPYGPPSLVTRSAGARVAELDDENAFDVFRRTAESCGDVVSREGFVGFAMLHPLGIPQIVGPDLIRDPLEVDAAGTLTCLGEVPEGSVVRLMLGGTAALLDAGAAAAADARAAAVQPVQGALLFDCFSRARLFGGQFPRELERIHAGLGERVPLMGCLTLGEVAAPAGCGIPEFQNKTAVVMAF
jgi:hypothetical protein